MTRRARDDAAAHVVHLDARVQQESQQTAFLTFLIGEVLRVDVNDQTGILQRELVRLLRGGGASASMKGFTIDVSVCTAELI